MTRRPWLGILVVAVLLPVLVSLTGVLLMLSWLPDLPVEVAVHWNAVGEVDGTASPLLYPVMLAVLGLALPAVFGGALALTARRRGTSRQQKLLAGTSLGVSLLLSAAFSWTVWTQRGIADAALAPNPVGVLLVAAPAAALLSLGAVLLLPRSTAAADPTAAGVEPAPLELAPGARAVWIRSASSSVGFVVLMAGVAVLLTGVVAVVLVTSGARLWPIALTPALIILLLVTTTQYRVRVDDSGVTVRSMAGVPRFRVPIAEISAARVVDVDPLSDFGGWGLRWGVGRRFGIVVRAGEGLEVERTDGRSLVVTVDDAATAAALLGALLARRSSGAIG